MTRVDIPQLAAPGIDPGTAQGDEAAGVEVADAFLDPIDHGHRFEAVHVGRPERRLHDPGHHGRGGSVTDHVGNQHGNRAVAGLDVIVDVPGQLVAGKIPRGDGQDLAAPSRSAAGG